MGPTLRSLAAAALMLTASACESSVRTTVAVDHSGAISATAAVVLSGAAARNARSDPNVGAQIVKAFKRWAAAPPTRTTSGDTETWSVALPEHDFACQITGVGDITDTFDAEGVHTVQVDLLAPTALIDAVDAEEDPDARRAIATSTFIEIEVALNETRSGFTGSAEPSLSAEGHALLRQALAEFEPGTFTVTGTPPGSSSRRYLYVIGAVTALIAAAVIRVRVSRPHRERRRSR